LRRNSDKREKKEKKKKDKNRKNVTKMDPLTYEKVNSTKSPIAASTLEGENVVRELVSSPTVTRTATKNKSEQQRHLCDTFVTEVVRKFQEQRLANRNQKKRKKKEKKKRDRNLLFALDAARSSSSTINNSHELLILGLILFAFRVPVKRQNLQDSH
jgi:hypothetical protein